VSELENVIWNRAAMERGGQSPLVGDIALAALLRLHSRAMSGGLLDAVETLASATDFNAAVDGYRFFGLGAVATVIEDVRSQVTSEGYDDDAATALEADADLRYGELVVDDGVLFAAFQARLAADPEKFSPTE
jgi:hypothetical protein